MDKYIFESMEANGYYHICCKSTFYTCNECPMNFKERTVDKECFAINLCNMVNKIRKDSRNG